MPSPLRKVCPGRSMSSVASSTTTKTSFSAVSGSWTQPTADCGAGSPSHSAFWVGLGGYSGDHLEQTGTSADCSATGQASYSAWYEVIPAPSLTISKMKVSAGDHMHAAVSQVVGGVDLWKITLQDLTKNETYTTTVPYSSTHDTAEWIEETPLEIGTNAGFAALPNLTSPDFDLATTNGQPANLNSSEEMQLIDSNSNVIGTPSAPDSDTDGFAACTWATSCSVPTS